MDVQTFSFLSKLKISPSVSLANESFKAVNWLSVSSQAAEFAIDKTFCCKLASGTFPVMRRMNWVPGGRAKALPAARCCTDPTVVMEVWFAGLKKDDSLSRVPGILLELDRRWCRHLERRLWNYFDGWGLDGRCLDAWSLDDLWLDGQLWLQHDGRLHACLHRISQKCSFRLCAWKIITHFRVSVRSTSSKSGLTRVPKKPENWIVGMFFSNNPAFLLWY